MKKYQHGGDIYSHEILHDFSANINPLGIPDSVKNALISSIDSFSAYPDTECRVLTTKIAEYENVLPKNILCGNGAADLIYRIVYAKKPKKALLIAPTFSEYEKALLSVDCEIKYHCLTEENMFTLTQSILGELTFDIDVFFLCNPNNPVGNVINPRLLEKIIEKCTKEKILLVVDECFLDFVLDCEKYSAKKYLSEKIIILKAFTKIYAMAGLRLGYVLCENIELIEKMRNCGQVWSVSTPAQIAGVAAISESEYREKAIKIIVAEREYLKSNLTHLGMKVYSSETNFILFKSEISLENELLKQNIAIRSCANYGGLNDKFYRIAVKMHYENVVLINAIERILKNG